ncbi:hypothetical protein [Bradyrhizobium icense]|uniref:Uncharacterized protein n=1 Tax=Bradyrhizobium icense TaxID=1274631 RepID=A0A1B1UD38_9BRAD|nr:hypothetical protein [Bradyrhizobium icense]ANW00674.1 hypothetical protein LMTR13_11345 [Bradyrhizobium icense]
MIRDPSDGSVKEISPNANETKAVRAKTLSKGITSGLPTLEPEQLVETVRLQRSREWLKGYHDGNVKPERTEECTGQQ